jgi:hypothetical protein
MNEQLNKEEKALLKRKKDLKKEAKKMHKSIKRLETKNDVLRKLVLEKANGSKYEGSAGEGQVHATTVDDIAALGDIQRDLNSVLVQLRSIDIQSGELQGGMNGPLDDEEQLYDSKAHRQRDAVLRSSDVLGTDEEDGWVHELRRETSTLETDAKRREQEGELFRTAYIGSLPSVDGFAEEETDELSGSWKYKADSMFAAVGEDMGGSQLHPQGPQLHVPGYKQPGDNAPKSRQMSLEDSGVPKPKRATGSSPTIILQLNAGFTVASYTFHQPVTVCHFPRGTEDDAVWGHVMRNANNTTIISMSGEKEQGQVMSAIARVRRHRRVLHMWASGEDSETLIVADKNIARGEPSLSSLPRTCLRGGSSGTDTSHDASFAEEIDALYDCLAQGYDDYTQVPPREETWVLIVNKLQKRIRHLDKQLVEYKDMYDSAMEDVEWNVKRLAESEEAKANALVELGFAKKEIRDTKKEIRDTNKEIRDTNKEIRDTKKDNKLVSMPLSTSQLQPSATCFYFYPSRSVVVIPGSPAQALQFPRGSNLYNVHEMLNRQHKKGGKLNPAASVVLEIMNSRHKLGIQLPETLLDEAVLISVPETPATDNSVQIAAWETVDNEYIEFIPRQEETVPVTRPVVARTSSADVVATRSHELAHLINAFDSFQGDSTTPSVCSCKSCAAELAPDGHKHAPPTVSIRGGGDENEWDYYDDEDPEPYDEDDYEEDIVHEDDANDPWDAYRGGGKDDWNDFS